MVLDMLDEMRTFGVYFLRGLVPWIGFTIYTAVGVMLYSSYFPSPEDDSGLVERGRERVVRGCSFLGEMGNQWPMAVQWSETIKRMQAFYRSQIGQGTPVSHDERQKLGRAMVDYGALQPSPVHRHGSGSESKGDVGMHTHSHSLPPIPSTQTPSSHSHTQSQPPNINNIMSPPASIPTPNAHISVWTPVQQHQREVTVEHDTASTMDDYLDFGFDGRGGGNGMLSNQEMEDIMSATQEFWASFPGEVGVPGPF